MNLRDVNWRFAVYFGGLLGGAVWAVVAATVMNAQDGTGATRFSVSGGSWLVILAASFAVLLVGTAVSALGRSIVLRSAGIGLAICALSGWVMVAWIAVQALIGG
jgi:hypothetical protein